ncbi:MAG: fluoride efflux transporter FluC [Saccharofermentanales bacterium]
MRRYLLIGAGGAAGAILRFLIRGIAFDHYFSFIPLGTLAINAAGCFFIAFVIHYASAKIEFHKDWMLGITVGLIGAFTTFSTLCKEAADLMIDGIYFFAFLYILLSVFLGFGCAVLGIAMASKLIRCGRRGEA